MLIKTLKDEVVQLKKNEANNEKLMFEIAQENKKLSEPLMVALGEVNQLRNELANYQKDKLSLKSAKARLQTLEQHLKGLEWEHEVLEQSYKKVQQERDELYQKFEKTIQDVQKKILFKNQLLETKVGTLQEVVEKKDAQLREIIKQSKLDKDAIGEITATSENIIEEKNKRIRELEFELEKVTKAHNDVIRVYESKLAQYGIPPEELAIVPLLATATTTAPAGLVSG